MAKLDYIKAYDPEFLGGGFTVPMPTARCRGRLAHGGAALDYIHYSLVLHAERKTALFVANNVDTRQLRSVGDIDDDDWEYDPRAPDLQTGEEVYGGTPWDRGHLAMRQHVAWGASERDAVDASSATYFYTNAAPQHKNFNQDEWLRLEQWMSSAASAHEGRLCIFTGPLYTKKDESVNGVRIPAAFWKVGVMRDGTVGGADLVVAAFVVKQTTTTGDWAGNVVENLKIHQVGLRELGPAAGLDFGPLVALDDYEWRSARFRDRRRMGWIPISGPSDIVFQSARRRAAGVRALPRGAAPEAASASGEVAKRDCGCGPRRSSEGEAIAALSRQVARMEGLLQGLFDMFEAESAPGADRAAARMSARKRAGRILGGVDAQPGEYPDCVCLGNASGWFCTGVLVRPTVVLTAAHCVPEGITRVLVGAPSLALSFQGEVVPVARVIRHPDYDPWQLPWNDIAIVILSRPAVKATPRAVATAAELAKASDVNLVGFGYNHATLERGFGTKRVLKDADRLPHELLLRTDPATLFAHEAHNEWEHSAELYVGEVGLGLDTCRGDSGGPVYIYVDEPNGDTVEKVAALTSRASGAALNPSACGDGGVYTQIAPYGEWIARETNDPTFADGGAPPAAGGGLYIAAALPNPVGGDKGNEWVELANGGGAAVALDGHTLVDGHGRSLSLDGDIAPGARRRFVIPSSGSLLLANAGGTIVLRKGSTELHRVQYGHAASGHEFSFEAPNPGPNPGPDPGPNPGPDPGPNPGPDPITEENRWQSDPC